MDVKTIEFLLYANSIRDKFHGQVCDVGVLPSDVDYADCLRDMAGDLAYDSGIPLNFCHEVADFLVKEIT